MSRRLTGFTLIELLIVISIIAILAATLIPNFVGFDTEARVTTTKANLETLRTRIALFRAKEGRYPDSLKELLDKQYFDVGVKKPYLNKIPSEMISVKPGNNEYIDINSTETPLARTGGWAYYKDLADVHVNIDGALGKKWGEYENQKPIEW